MRLELLAPDTSCLIPKGWRSLLGSLCLHGLLLLMCLWRPVGYALEEPLFVMKISLSGPFGSGTGSLGQAPAGAAFASSPGSLFSEKNEGREQNKTIHPEPARQTPESSLKKKDSEKKATRERLARKKGAARPEAGRSGQALTGPEVKGSGSPAREAGADGATGPVFAASDGAAAPGTGGGPGGDGGGDRGGSGGGDGKAYITTNLDYIRKRIERRLVYPGAAERMRLTGRSYYRFTVDAQGRISHASVVRSCGHAVLDEAGLKAILAASPVPPPPRPVRIDMPIDFTLR